MLCRIYRWFFRRLGLPTPSAAAWMLSLYGDDRWREFIDGIFKKFGQQDHCRKAHERAQANG